MPKCPECGAEIDYLINVCETIEEYIFSVDGGGFADYEQTDAWAGDWSEYRCPECRKVLFRDEDDAVKFLKGE